MRVRLQTDCVWLALDLVCGKSTKILLIVLVEMNECIKMNVFSVGKIIIQINSKFSTIDFDFHH